MNCAASITGRVREVCRNIDQVASIEALYENLCLFLVGLSEVTGAAFLSIAHPYGRSFQINQGTGRYSGSTGSSVQEAAVLEQLGCAMQQRCNHYSPGAVTFFFPHPENLAILVYVELSQPVDAEARDLHNFINDRVASAIQEHGLSKQAMRTGRAMVIALASLAEHKDQETGDHILRVAIMTDEIVQVLEEMGCYPEIITPEFERYISTASILHDVGKIAIPDEILKKPGKLDAEERRIIQTHTTKGQKVLEKASRILDGNNYLLNLSCEIALNHHEHYNGQGYPEQLAGQEIPLSARIISLIDVYDALTSERPYKKPWAEQEAVDYIVAQSGKQFDPLIVAAFLKTMEHRRGVALIKWTEALSVKILDMDNDHRVLISLINQLASAEKIGNRRVVESVLDELLNYTIDHFNREEQFLHKSAYPFAELVAHKLKHAAFTETVQDIRWQYLQGFRPRINQEVLFFLRDWLSRHILIEDMKYRDHFNLPNDPV